MQILRYKRCRWIAAINKQPALIARQRDGGKHDSCRTCQFAFFLPRVARRPAGGEARCLTEAFRDVLDSTLLIQRHVHLYREGLMHAILASLKSSSDCCSG